MAGQRVQGVAGQVRAPGLGSQSDADVVAVAGGTIIDQEPSRIDDTIQTVVKEGYTNGDVGASGP